MVFKIQELLKWIQKVVQRLVYVLITLKILMSIPARLHNADMVKGAAMNVSRILQWLQSLTTTHNYVAAKEGKLNPKTGELDSYTKSTYKPNFVVKAGENTYLVLKEGKELKDVQQLIADYIQSSLDASGGYNMNRVTIDNMWRDLLYRPETSIFNVMNVNEVAIKGSRTPKTILEKSTDTSISLEGDKKVRKVLDGIINPYKDMLSLSNKIYEMGKGETVGWTDLITGIQQANKNLRYLGSKKWYKDNYLTDKDINFHDIGKNAALDKASTNNINLPMYDRVLANVMHLNNITINPNKSITLSEPFRDSFELLMTSETQQEAYKAVKKELTDSYKLTDFINQAQKELNELYEYKERFKDYKTRERITNYSIKPLEKRLNYLKNQISIELKDYGIIRATSKAEAKAQLIKDTKKRDGKKYKQNQQIVDNIIDRYAKNVIAEKMEALKQKGDFRELTKDELKQAYKEATDMFLEKGFYVEPTITNEMIKYIAINDVFGRINVMNHNELKLSQGKFNEINTEISNVMKEFRAGIKDLKEVHKEVLNWEFLYENTFLKLDKIAKDHQKFISKS